MSSVAGHLQNCAAYRSAARSVVALTLFFAALILPSCRHYGDFWNRKPNQESGGGLLPNQVHPVTFTPGAGSYNATQNVALASITGGATICYTTDGTAPACGAGSCTAGTTYSGTITVSTDQTIKAIACKTEMVNSPEATAVYTIDTTPPVISGVAPTSSSYALNTQVSYTFSENCASASITWTRTGGNPDGASPHVKALVGAELTAGTHSNTTLTNNPILVDGAVYSVQFDCTDAAGNNATSVTSTNVTYDFNNPVISATAPASGSVRNNTQVSYTFSENCASASITWTRTGGTADGSSPHVKALTGSELTAGAHNNITITNNPTLVSGAIYDIAFTCTDAAGRNASTVTNTSVTFDNVAPTITGVAPPNSTFVNTTAVSYTLSENCASASITWTRTGGNADGASPHVKALVGSELTAGTKTNIIITNNPTLVDGAVYSVAFDCSDAAGNSAATVTRTNITYDVTAVVISGVAPASNAFRNSTAVSYTLSDNCNSASITWTRTGGSADGSSPHVKALVGAELNSGPHTNIILTNNPTLADGAIYSVTFNCTDVAGNNSTPVTVTNVTYDFTVPTISGTAPPNSAHRNNTQVSYTFSEDCASASITWTRTGGTADGSSPHVKALTGSELTAGAHNNITITNNPTLVSGSVYSVAFNCTDFAGNIASTVTHTNVTYDTTNPTVAIGNLLNNGTVLSGFVIGTANDNVAVASVEYNLDSAGWNAATYSAPNWKFALPTGSSTWRDRTTHTIQVRASDAAGNTNTLASISVRKGPNRDINGDGYGDLVVGGFKYNSFQGRVYIFYGGSAGITLTTATSANRIITGETGTTRFGRNSTLGDFNGDGFADLAVAATAYNTNSGRAYIFYGATGGISITAAGSADRMITHGTTNENFSSPLISGDINADGYADLLAGANGYSASLGRAYLFYGGASGITATSTASASATFTGEAISGQFSGALNYGDFDGDGRTDIIAGAPAVVTNMGRAYAVYGTASPFSGNITVVHTANSMITGGVDHFMGGSAAVGDFNGDGASDLAMGGYGTTGVSSLMRVFYGTSGTQNFSNNSAPIQTTVTESNLGYFFTTAIASGDLNSDGKDELCVSAHGGSADGYVAVFFGSSTPLTATLPSHAGYMRSGSGLTSAGQQFGRGLGISDVNGDGYPDLLVGANFVSTDTGAVFIFHSSSSGPVATPSQTISGENGSEFGISFAR